MAEGEEIDSLLVRLGLDADKEEFNEANSMFNGLKTTALQVGAVIGGGIGFQKLTTGFAEATEEIGRFADRFSTTPEFVDALGFAMSQIGGDADEAFGSIEKVANLIEDTEWGDIPSDAFRVAGFDPLMLEGVTSVAEAYERISDAVDGLSPEEARRSLKALGFGDTEIDLFTGTGGESLRNLIAEGMDLGTINREMTEQGKEFNKATGRLGKSMDSLSKNMSTLFMDDLVDTVNDIAEFLKNNLEEITGFFESALPWLEKTAVGVLTLVAIQSGRAGGGALLRGLGSRSGVAGLAIAAGAGVLEVGNRFDRETERLREQGQEEEARRREQHAMRSIGGSGGAFMMGLPSDVRPDTPVSGGGTNVKNEINVDARGSTNPSETRRQAEKGMEAYINRLSENTIIDVENPFK